MLWDVVWPDHSPDGEVTPGESVSAAGHDLGIVQLCHSCYEAEAEPRPRLVARSLEPNESLEDPFPILQGDS